MCLLQIAADVSSRISSFCMTRLTGSVLMIRSHGLPRAGARSRLISSSGATVPSCKWSTSIARLGMRASHRGGGGAGGTTSAGSNGGTPTGGTGGGGRAGTGGTGGNQFASVNATPGSNYGGGGGCGGSNDSKATPGAAGAQGCIEIIYTSLVPNQGRAYGWIIG